LQVLRINICMVVYVESKNMAFVSGRRATHNTVIRTIDTVVETYPYYSMIEVCSLRPAPGRPFHIHRVPRAGAHEMLMVLVVAFGGCGSRTGAGAPPSIPPFQAVIRNTNYTRNVRRPGRPEMKYPGYGIVNFKKIDWLHEVAQENPFRRYARAPFP
jgi:hypothetical protein